MNKDKKTNKCRVCRKAISYRSKVCIDCYRTKNNRLAGRYNYSVLDE